MKRMLVVTMILLISLGLTACSVSQNNGNPLANNKSQTETSQTTSYQNIKPEDAKKLLESEKEIILLDVRTPAEYTEKHIPSSLLIPVDQIEKEAPTKISNKDTKIIVYCRSGSRSVAAAKALVNMGYTHVYNLGGINAWPYNTVSGQ